MFDGRRLLVFSLLACGTTLGLAGTDLVLPALPTLPQELGGDIGRAQLVIAAFIAGVAAGLVLFGAATRTLGRRASLASALLGYALLSFACTRAPGMYPLIVMRFLQGVFASAPAVIAPGVIRQMFSETGATRAIGIIGSLEALAPALAPVLGVWLLTLGGWQTAFLLTGVLGLVLAAGIGAVGSAFPPSDPSVARGSYRRLLCRPVFLRYALSQALVLGGLLIFVFGTPAVIVMTMAGGIGQFITMQIVGVTCFIVAANVSGSLVRRFGAEAIITFGTVLACGSALAILAYALSGGHRSSALPILFAPMNFALGVRGPPGFLRAILAGAGDDERASSLTLLAIMAIASGGTALLAPFLHVGLLALALAAVLAQALAVASLLWLPRLADG
jgi:MFS transporter, DHA1 family, multidrug resistance protein